MKVTSAPLGVSAPTLRHAAGFHATTVHLLRQLTELASDAARRGETIALVTADETAEALRTALPEITFHDLARQIGPDGGSGQTVALRMARDLRELTAETGHVTVLSEHRAELDGPDGAFWTELDAAANVALAALPVSLTCFFPEMPLHQSVVDGARRNHPALLVGGELRHNAEHRGPREVLAGQPAAVPALLGAPDLELRFRAWQLQQVRHTVADLARSVGLGGTRLEDVVLAVNEVATNAVEHGTLEAELVVWASADGLVCEVHDSGRLGDPLPGLHAPHPSDPRGRGLWIARQLCDLLHVWSDAAGTHVRVRAAP